MKCFLVDDGGPEMIVVEEGDDPQALWVRVGPVFDDNVERCVPGVWICWQDRYMESPLGGPVLLTPEVWRELARAVERRLRRREPPRKRIMRRLFKCLIRVTGRSCTGTGKGAGIKRTWVFMIPMRALCLRVSVFS